jgi:uncharacterized membrane protein YidH (DUF202 family)
MSYVESNLVQLALPGAILLNYALSQTEIESKNLHIVEGGGLALIACGVVVILMGMVRWNATEMAVTIDAW